MGIDRPGGRPIQPAHLARRPGSDYREGREQSYFLSEWLLMSQSFVSQSRPDNQHRKSIKLSLSQRMDVKFLVKENLMQIDVCSRPCVLHGWMKITRFHLGFF